MRENGYKRLLCRSIGPTGLPQCQHAIEAQAIDRLHAAGVLDLPREPKLTHRIDIFGGVCSDESAALLREFFEARR